MVSVSRSLAFLLLINEMSSGFRGRLSGVWSAAPAPPRDLHPYQLRAHSWACYCPLQTALLSSHPRCHLSARRHWQDELQPQSFHLPASVPLTSPIVCVCMCVYPSPFPFLSLWVLSSFSDLYSNPTFSLKPSLITQARVFFLPGTLTTVGVIWISPLTAWCPGYLCGYLVPSEETYTGETTNSFL